MTPKERIKAACEKRPVDRVPVYHACISSRAASILLGREAFVGGGIQQYREAVALWNGPEAHAEFLVKTRQDTIDIAEPLGVDMVRTSYWRMNEKPAKRVDENTFLYGDPEKSWRVMRFDAGTELYQTIDWSPKVVQTEDDLEAQVSAMERDLPDFRPPDTFMADIRMGLDAFGDFHAVPGGGVGVGIEYRSPAWLEAVVTRPDLVERWLDVLAERAIRYVEALSDVDVQVMLGGGDMATNEGPMYSPRAFRELLIPRLKRVVDACHKHGKYYFFASDGNLWPVADDLFTVVDGYYEIDRRAGMDLKLLRKRYPNLTVIGNISSHTLHLGTKDEVVAETMYCIEASKEYGGVIAGCSNLIMCQTPEENLRAMVETFEAHG